MDKLYSKKLGFVRNQWNGKHHRTVKGIGLVTLLWTDGNKILPVDFRIYDIDEDEKTKNDHFRDMLDKAKERGFKPKFVMFDIWYAILSTVCLLGSCRPCDSNRSCLKYEQVSCHLFVMAQVSLAVEMLKPYHNGRLEPIRKVL